jgi:predicted MPP superfamily phosphohydrolase
MPNPLKNGKMNRRRFLAAAFVFSPLLAAADAKWIEPSWIKLRNIRLGKDKVRHRFIHFTDLHHKGEVRYLETVVQRVNMFSPEFVCFTGDLIEDKLYLDETLRIISKIKAPVYGVPGNHDYWSKAPFPKIAACFESTGGRWLVEQQESTKDGNFTILGTACLNARTAPLKAHPRTRNILLMHYPAWVDNLGNQSYDLILAGHSHGGQVRFPFYGAIILPFGVGRYDLGMFHTKSGPLYVNPGIGWFPIPVRFNCRPEITVFEV